MVLLFAQQLGIGIVAGIAVGRLVRWPSRRSSSPRPGLYPVASLAAAALAFGSAAALHGSGFLAVYLTGLALGTGTCPPSAGDAFHEGLAWVAQLGMFLTLGLLVFPSELGEVAWKGTLLALVVVFVSRPLATVVSLIGPRFASRKDAHRLGRAARCGPRRAGHVPDHRRRPAVRRVLQHRLLRRPALHGAAGHDDRARRALAGGDVRRAGADAELVEVGAVRELGGDVVEHVIREGDAAAGARLRDLGLPRDALVSLIVRGDEVLLPRGSTRLEAGDRMLVLARREVAGELPAILDRWRKGPVTRPVRPPRTYTGSVPIYTARPWSEADGDPAHPQAVSGVEVVEHVRTRRDVPGALVVLKDGRYAVTGPILMMGPPGQMQTQARRRMARTDDDAEISWWQEVIGACAL